MALCDSVSVRSSATWMTFVKTTNISANVFVRFAQVISLPPTTLLQAFPQFGSIFQSINHTMTMSFQQVYRISSIYWMLNEFV